MIQKPAAWAYLAPATLSAIALFELPYGYYQFLRILVTGCCIWIAAWHNAKSNTPAMLLFGALAILFNPLFKVHMSRDLHEIFNILTTICLLGSLYIDHWRKSA